MLKILHKGHQISIPMDQTGFTGNIVSDIKLPVVQKMVGGRVAALVPNGTPGGVQGAVTQQNAVAAPFGGVATLADGNPANGLVPLGFIINDAEGYFYENKPAFASGMIAVALLASSVVCTDQLDPAVTFNPGDKVYVGTGATLGLVTNVAPAASAVPFGVALSAASSASPELTIACL